MRQKKDDVPAPPQSVPTTSPTRWLTIAEAAIYARRSEQAIRSWIHGGGLRASKPDANYLIDRQTLDEFLIRHERVVGPYRVGTRPAVARRHATNRKAVGR
jgi:excisionase family DNA binding protein